MLDIIFVKGGFVMYVIIALSIYVLGVLFFKAYQFVTGGVFNMAFIDRAMVLIKRGELTDASFLLAREKGPLARKPPSVGNRRLHLLNPLRGLMDSFWT